jgi:opacity protein-like surface antigen
MVSPQHGGARAGARIGCCRWATLLKYRGWAVTSVDRWGFTIGGGIEQALTERWSIVGAYR